MPQISISDLNKTDPCLLTPNPLQTMTIFVTLYLWWHNLSFDTLGYYCYHSINGLILCVVILDGFSMEFVSNAHFLPSLALPKDPRALLPLESPLKEPSVC